MPFISVVRALFDYKAKDGDELGFAEGDVLCLLSVDELDSEWLTACLLQDQSRTGLIPNNYVSPVEPLGQVTALYAYEAHEANEIGFSEGETLELLVRLEDDWWMVRKEGRTYGMAPSNYFEPFDSNKSQVNIFGDEAAADGANGASQQQSIRWIDTVDVKYAWSAKLTLGKNDRRKGELVIGEDGTMGFVSGQAKDQFLKFDLSSVASYDRKRKALKILGLEDDPIQLELSKPNAEQFQKEIAASKERAEREAQEWEQARTLQYARDGAPELPDRRASPSSPGFANPAAALGAMLQRRLDSPQKSPLASVLAAISKEPSPAGSPTSADPAPLGPIVVALYSYEPMEEDELKVSEDEKLVLVDDESEDWWLVQRMAGSRRKGLVPSSYLQRESAIKSPTGSQTPYERIFGAASARYEQEAEEEDGGLIQPRSPRSPTSNRPATPVGFMEEIKEKLKARSPVPTPDEEEDAEVAESPVDESCIQEEAGEEAAQEPGAEASADAEEPAQMTESTAQPAPMPRVSDYRDIPAPPPPPPVPVAEDVSEARPAPPVHKPSPEESVPVPAQTPRKSFIEAPSAPAGPAVKSEPKKVESTVQIPMPKLKPVLKDTQGFNALSTMLLRKREEVRTGRPAEAAPEPAAPVDERPNPWKMLTMKTIGEKERSVAAALPAPQNVQQPPQKAEGKPKPAETRLWTSRNGQFQVEAKFMGYQGGSVALHKLNGSRITVALDQLSERDKEFVYRREGIPWDQGPKRDFRVGSHDWLAFFMDCGIDPTAARVHAQACLDKKIGEAFLASPSFSREFLLSSLRMSEASALEVLRYTNALRARLAKDGEVRKNLEKIDRMKRDLEAVRQPVAAPRRSTEVFAELDIQGLNLNAPVMPAQQYTQAQPMQQQMPMPVHMQAMLQPPPPPPPPAKTMKDIPAMQPTRKDGVQPALFSSTTVLNTPAQYQAMQPHLAYQQTPPMQPMPQQPSLLPNLAQAKPYMPPPVQPTQQRFHSVQTGQAALPMPGYVPVPNAVPYPLGTSQIRTEYYGFDGQQAHQQSAYLPPASQMPVQPQRYMVSPPQHQQTTTQPAQHQQQPKMAVGDKYSIFRYVDPSAPQVLPQPGAYPNASQPSWQQ